MKLSEVLISSIVNILLIVVLIITFVFPEIFYKKIIFLLWAGGLIACYLFSLLNKRRI